MSSRCPSPARSLLALQLFLICLVLSPRKVPAQVVIDEVLPDPEGNDRSGEWVELHNRGLREMDLTGWSLGDDADPADLLRTRSGTGRPLLPPGGRALVVDPDGAAPSGLPPGTLLLEVDDASLGNGLRADGDRLYLRRPDGRLEDEAGWTGHPGTGCSLERAPDDPAAAGAVWLPCLAPEGHTAGRVNSRTPVPGDRQVFGRLSPMPMRAGEPARLVFGVRDVGGAGLTALDLQVRIGREGQPPLLTRRLRTPTTSPWDSSSTEMTWTPPRGGRWCITVVAAGPPPQRPWAESDTLLPLVAWAPRSRVVNEAVPRPLADHAEWLELSARDAGDPTGWEGWSLSLRSPGSRHPRELLLEGVGRVLVVTAHDSLPLGPGMEGPGDGRLVRRGLRLADAGSEAALRDPSGAVVDTAVLRPVPDLPRGHSLQRWDPAAEGWLPEAWGVSSTPASTTPGQEGYGPDRGPTGLERDLRGFRMGCSWSAGQGLCVSWSAPVPRLWLDLELFDLQGRRRARVLPRTLVPGTSRLSWSPGALPPGIYVLTGRARSADGAGSWQAKVAAGIRP